MTVPLRPLWRKHYASTSRLSSRGPAMFVVTAANLPPSDIPITSTTQSNAPGVVFGKTSGLSLNTPSQLTFKRPTTASAASPKFNTAGTHSSTISNAFTAVYHTVNPAAPSCVEDEWTCTAGGKEIVEARAIMLWD
ncbi:hypothetical protein MGN70_002463 [Eutypa lata]|nr:hypothetical protein MGN70_002463 [Eutypa lata]